MKLVMVHQGSRSLESHIQDFLDLAPQTHFPDKMLNVLYQHGLNILIKLQLSQYDSQGRFKDFVELALVLRGSHFTMGEVKRKHPLDIYGGGGSKQQSLCAGEPDRSQTPVCTTLMVASPRLVPEPVSQYLFPRWPPRLCLFPR